MIPQGIPIAPTVPLTPEEAERAFVAALVRLAQDIYVRTGRRARIVVQPDMPAIALGEPDGVLGSFNGLPIMFHKAFS